MSTDRRLVLIAVLLPLFAASAHAAEYGPALPEGMDLEEALARAAEPPPGHYPNPVFDDELYAFALLDQLEYRVSLDGVRDHLGWEAQGWIGYDFDKLWWKNEGSTRFSGRDEGESETDLLYSRLITPFWNAQVGVRYANEWSGGDYKDSWSAAIAIQGMAPYMFELDNSLYVSEDGDVSLEVEAEYDIRITQRLVAQPRVEFTAYAQDIPEKNVGAGLAEVTLDFRLRYEVKREFAPYVGLRYRFLVGETDNRAEAAGANTEQLALLIGLRIAF